MTIYKSLKLLVPDEGIEPPTFGLQNRCSTAELIRLTTPKLGAYSLLALIMHDLSP
jgi:hypothetical protein